MNLELTTDELNAQKDAVFTMSNSDGWAVIKNRLLEEQQELVSLLLSIIAIPENLSQIAQVQAQINGSNYILDMVQDYTTPDTEDEDE